MVTKTKDTGPESQEALQARIRELESVVLADVQAVEQVAKTLGCSVRTLRRYIAAGKLELHRGGIRLSLARALVKAGKKS